jgi:serine O-acetyltransferase
MFANSRMSVWQLILSDLDRYRVTDQRNYLTMLVICPGTLACITYRIGHWLWIYSGPLSFTMPVWRAVFIVFSRFIEIITGMRVAPRAKIGPGLYIGHSGCVVIGGGVTMGRNCNVQQGVTIGGSGRGEKKGSPTIGDRVFFGPGAKVFGDIEVGDDVAIGANAVVTRSVPSRAVAVGIPARVRSCRGSFDYIMYRHMENDPERIASLAMRDEMRDEINVAVHLAEDDSL